jgi:quinol-cytochrome oxidoreductase complex cytochrome b subunit
MVVPCDRTIKQLWSSARETQPNKMAQKAMQQVSPIHPMLPWYFLPAYSSLIYFLAQAWGSAAINPYYMYHPFSYSA